MPTIHYTLAMPQTHLFHVEVMVQGFDQTSNDWTAPGWRWPTAGPARMLSAARAWVCG